MLMGGVQYFVGCALAHRYSWCAKAHPTSNSIQLSSARAQGGAADALDLFLALQSTQSGDGGFDEIFGARRAVGLGKNIRDAGQLEARPHALAGGDASSRTSGNQNHLARAAGALHLVRNRGALEIHLEHRLAGVLGCFFDRRRNFVGLAIADADASATIAGDDQRAEAECPPALQHLGAAIDTDNGRFDAAFLGFPASVAVAPWATAMAAAPTTATTPAFTATTAPSAFAAASA